MKHDVKNAIKFANVFFDYAIANAPRIFDEDKSINKFFNKQIDKTVLTKEYDIFFNSVKSFNIDSYPVFAIAKSVLEEKTHKAFNNLLFAINHIENNNITIFFNGLYDFMRLIRITNNTDADSHVWRSRLDKEGVVFYNAFVGTIVYRLHLALHSLKIKYNETPCFFSKYYVLFTKRLHIMFNGNCKVERLINGRLVDALHRIVSNHEINVKHMTLHEKQVLNEIVFNTEQYMNANNLMIDKNIINDCPENHTVVETKKVSQNCNEKEFDIKITTSDIEHVFNIAVPGLCEGNIEMFEGNNVIIVKITEGNDFISPGTYKIPYDVLHLVLSHVSVKNGLIKIVFKKKDANQMKRIKFV